MLLRVDGRGVYSTNKDATMKLSMAPDDGMAVLENATVTSASTRHAVATYGGTGDGDGDDDDDEYYDDDASVAASAVLHLQDSLGAFETLRWRSPRRLRVSFANPPWRSALEAALASSSDVSNRVVTSRVLNVSLSTVAPAAGSPTKSQITYLRRPVANHNGRFFSPLRNETY